MKTKQVDLHMEQKRALYRMLFFAMLLSFVGAFASAVVNRDCVQLSSLFRSEYEYSVTSKNPASQDSYYQFNAGINYAVSRESTISINADILMQSREASYTKAVAWNPIKLNENSVAISKGIAEKTGIKVGDEIFSKHIVDGQTHVYTVQQILPDIITARVDTKRTYSDGVIIMGVDDLYVNNISHSFVSYTSIPIDDLVREISDVPENILYRSDEINTVLKDLIPYLAMFIAASVVVVVVSTWLLAKDVRYNFERLKILGYARKQLDTAYWMTICKVCIPAVCIGFAVAIGVSFLFGINSAKIIVQLILLLAEAVAMSLSTLLHNRHLWR